MFHQNLNPQVDLKGYNLLLDYPDLQKPNLIKLFNDSKEVWTSKYQEENLHEGDDHEDFVHSFLAYSAQGKAEGEIVYVNYGTKEDFELIANASNPSYYTNVTGKICLIRYGQIFRGNKVSLIFCDSIF